MRTNSERRVAVTGIGVITPVGLSVPELWSALISGRSGVGPITRFDCSDFDTKIAAEVKGFEVAGYVGRKEGLRMARFTQFAVAASLQAVENARLQINGNSDQIGVIFGNSVAGLSVILEQNKVLSEMGPGRVSPFLTPTMASDAATVQVSLILGAKGPSFSISSACCSGNDAIGQGYELIKHGVATAIIAGGTETPIIPVIVAGFNALRVMSVQNDFPEEACRPFDKMRDGLVLGEGAAALVLEDMTHALERGAPVLAEIVGYVSNSDAFHIARPATDGKGATKAIQVALERSGMTPEDVDYVNAHGTATVVNDKSETEAIKAAFGEYATTLPISATKSMTGHLLGAGGALEAAISVLAIDHQLIPPTINLVHADPECDLDYVPNVPREVEINVAVSNSFGFGGHNSVLVFKRQDTISSPTTAPNLRPATGG